MMMKTIYATSLYLLITGLTSVSASQVANLQSFGFGTCMFAARSAADTPVTLATCDFDTPAQDWEFTLDTPAEIRLSGTNFCLDPTGLLLKICSGGADQKFDFSNEGIITLNVNSGQCLGAQDAGNLKIGACRRDQNDFWTIV